MALTDTFTKQVKHTGKPAGDKHTDGEGMFLLVFCIALDGTNKTDGFLPRIRRKPQQ
jgi:hypothetical protein